MCVTCAMRGWVQARSRRCPRSWRVRSRSAPPRPRAPSSLPWPPTRRAAPLPEQEGGYVCDC
eukprot:1433208-Rhodomonas_salina.1